MRSRRNRRIRQHQQLVMTGVVLIALLMVIGTLRIIFHASSASAPASTDTYMNPEGDAPAAVAAPQQVSVLGIYGKLVLLLGAALAAALCLKWLGSSASGLQRAPTSAQEPPGKILLTVRDAITLGRSRELHLVEVAGQILVIGSCADQMALLAQWSSGPAQPAPAPAQVAVREPSTRVMDCELSYTRPMPRQVVQERDWAERRARLIDALREQVEA